MDMTEREAILCISLGSLKRPSRAGEQPEESRYPSGEGPVGHCTFWPSTEGYLGKYLFAHTPTSGSWGKRLLVGTWNMQLPTDVLQKPDQILEAIDFWSQMKSCQVSKETGFWGQGWSWFLGWWIHACQVCSTGPSICPLPTFAIAICPPPAFAIAICSPPAGASRSLLRTSVHSHSHPGSLSFPRSLAGSASW